MKLPVEPERLRRQFPSLSNEDLDAYVAVTKRVLAEPAAKGRILRALMKVAESAKERPSDHVTKDEALALRYLEAIRKMQLPVAGNPSETGRPRRPQTPRVGKGKR
jgi:hypothetical protein